MEYIRIDKIMRHPDNPRKDLGNLDELTESIRAFGVLQNLTVVPGADTDQYTVICGHRRLAAAKAAGLNELPCIVIEDMDKKTQISIMLLENMQRSDLTPQEEAHGFQMMLDLGGSISEIVEKTGLSETKVRHRVKLNELDQKLLSEKMGKNISINDLIKLEKIKDPDRRNKALEKIGTNNFDWAVDNAVYEEKKETVLERLKEMLPDAEFTANWSAYPQVASLKYEKCEEADIVDFVNTLLEESVEADAPIMVHIGWSEALGRIMKERNPEETQPDPEAEERRQTLQQRKNRLQSMKDRMVERARAFVLGITETKAKLAADKMMPYTARYLSTAYACTSDDLLDLLIPDAEERNSIEDEDAEYKTICLEQPYRATLVGTVKAMMPSPYQDWWDYEGHFKENKNILSAMTDAYVLLGTLGYDVSDEEAGFLVGDSDLYLREEDDE